MKKLSQRWVKSLPRQRELARAGLDDLKDQNLEVVLVPAPEKKHRDHKIRMVTNHNPAWYKEMAGRRDSAKHGCGSLRFRVIRALKRLRAGWHDPFSMDEEILEEIEYYLEE